MLRKLRPRSAYDVVALLALFIAVGGGTAFAVVAANQVNSASIIDKQVKNQDLAPSSVGTGKVLDGSLLKRDFKAGQLPTAISFDRQFPSDDSTYEVARFNGFQLKVHCRPANPPYAYIEINTLSDQAFYAWGTKTEDGVMSHTSRFVAPITVTAANTAELDVVASATRAGEPTKWTRFDITVIRGGGCNYHAMVTRSSSVG